MLEEGAVLPQDAATLAGCSDTVLRELAVTPVPKLPNARRRSGGSMAAAALFDFNRCFPGLGLATTRQGPDQWLNFGDQLI
jgi:hypothetical protein